MADYFRTKYWEPKGITGAIPGSSLVTVDRPVALQSSREGFGGGWAGVGRGVGALVGAVVVGLGVTLIGAGDEVIGWADASPDRPPVTASTTAASCK